MQLTKNFLPYILKDTVRACRGTVLFRKKTHHVGSSLKIRFNHLASAAAGICFALAVTWLCMPQLLLALWSVPFSDPVALVGRRNGALFAGVSVILFQLRHAAPSATRSAVAHGVAVACSTLALLGIAECALGHAGPGMLLAVAVEIMLALGFALTKTR